MNGTGDHRFQPQERLTRAMMAQILYNLEGAPDQKEDKAAEASSEGSADMEKTGTEEETASERFSDVKDTDWFAAAVSWAASNDIVNGFSETKFAPQNSILREQLVTMLYRYVDQSQHLKPDDYADLSDFSDSASVEEYAKAAFSWAVANEIVTGYSDGTLNPQAYATRAETAAILERYAEKYGHQGFLSGIQHLNQVYIRPHVHSFFEGLKGIIGGKN